MPGGVSLSGFGSGGGGGGVYSAGSGTRARGVLPWPVLVLVSAIQCCVSPHERVGCGTACRCQTGWLIFHSDFSGDLSTSISDVEFFNLGLFSSFFSLSLSFPFFLVISLLRLLDFDSTALPQKRKSDTRTSPSVLTSGINPVQGMHHRQ